MHNRVTLAQLRDMDVKEVASLPIDQVADLLEEIAVLRADAKLLGDRVADALHHRFGDMAASLRRAKGTDTGTVRITEPDAGCVVIADLPKKVSWDQAVLRRAIDQLRDWGEDPDEYVTIELSVAETRFKAWPSKIKALFEPGRVVAPGRPTYKIEKKETA